MTTPEIYAITKNFCSERSIFARKSCEEGRVNGNVLLSAVFARNISTSCNMMYAISNTQQETGTSFFQNKDGEVVIQQKMQ